MEIQSATSPAINVESAGKVIITVEPGSENTLSMYDTALYLCRLTGWRAPVAPLTEPRHNLWMNCARLRRQGIAFSSAAEGLRACCAAYGLLAENA